MTEPDAFNSEAWRLKLEAAIAALEDLLNQPITKDLSDD